MVLAVALGRVGKLAARLGDVGAHRLDQRIVRHVRRRQCGAGRALPRRAFHRGRLRRHQLGGQIVQARQFDVHAVVVEADDALFLLVLGQAGLRGLDVVAQLLGLFVEVRGRLLGRIGLQLDGDLLVLVGERVRHRGRERGVRALEADLDDGRFARRHDLQFLQQQVGQPVAHRAPALGRLPELFDDGRAIGQVQGIDDAQRHVLAADDVDLRGHIARQQLARHRQPGQWIHAFVVQQNGCRCLVRLGLDQAEPEGQRDRDQQGRQDDLLPCKQDQQELMDVHDEPLKRNGTKNRSCRYVRTRILSR